MRYDRFDYSIGCILVNVLGLYIFSCAWRSLLKTWWSLHYVLVWYDEVLVVVDDRIVCFCDGCTLYEYYDLVYIYYFVQDDVWLTG